MTQQITASDPESSGDPDTAIDADDQFTVYGNDPGGYDRNGAFDGRQVYSDADGGL